MYFICYEHPEKGRVYETVDGEDAMRRRVHDLTCDFDLDYDCIHVFRWEDEL